MEKMNVGKDVGAVVQAISILRALADANEPLSVTAISRASGVSPSTSLNILRTLVGHGLVGLSSGSKTYYLDIGLLEFARTLLNRSQVELLRPELQRLTTRFEATATVWQAHGDKHLLLGRVVPSDGIHIEFPVATKVSAYAGATGRIVVALSQIPEDVVQAAFKRIKWNAPITFRQYMKEANAARVDGYAVDAGILLRGVTSVASAIVDGQGKPGITVSMHTFLGQLSPKAVRELGQELRLLCERARPALYGRERSA